MREAEGGSAFTSEARTPNFEDVRLMIRAEIRAALAEMFRTPASGAHTMTATARASARVDEQRARNERAAHALAAVDVQERRDFGPRPEALDAGPHCHTGTPYPFGVNTLQEAFERWSAYAVPTRTTRNA